MSGRCDYDCDCCDHDSDGVMVWRTRQRLLQILPPLPLCATGLTGGCGRKAMRECEGHVGSDRYLIQACKAGFKQHIVSADFFKDLRVLPSYQSLYF